MAEHPHITKLRQIAAGGPYQKAKVDGKSVSHMHAQAMIAVHDGLNDENKAKFADMPITKKMAVTQRLMDKGVVKWGFKKESVNEDDPNAGRCLCVDRVCPEHGGNKYCANKATGPHWTYCGGCAGRKNLCHVCGDIAPPHSDRCEAHAHMESVNEDWQNGATDSYGDEHKQGATLNHKNGTYKVFPPGEPAGRGWSVWHEPPKGKVRRSWDKSYRLQDFHKTRAAAMLYASDHAEKGEIGEPMNRRGRGTAEEVIIREFKAVNEVGEKGFAKAMKTYVPLCAKCWVKKGNYNDVPASMPDARPCVGCGKPTKSHSYLDTKPVKESEASDEAHADSLAWVPFSLEAFPKAQESEAAMDELIAAVHGAVMRPGSVISIHFANDPNPVALKADRAGNVTMAHPSPTPEDFNLAGDGDDGDGDADDQAVERTPNTTAPIPAILGKGNMARTEQAPVVRGTAPAKRGKFVNDKAMADKKQKNSRPNPAVKENIRGVLANVSNERYKQQIRTLSEFDASAKAGNYNVYCHHDDHSKAGFGDAWMKSAGHQRKDSLLIGSPQFGALWHCPEHQDCKTCPRGSWTDKEVGGGTRGYKEDVENLLTEERIAEIRGAKWRPLTPDERSKVQLIGAGCNTRQPWSVKKWTSQDKCSCGCGTDGFALDTSGAGGIVKLVGEKNPILRKMVQRESDNRMKEVRARDEDNRCNNCNTRIRPQDSLCDTCADQKSRRCPDCKHTVAFHSYKSAGGGCAGKSKGKWCNCTRDIDGLSESPKGRMHRDQAISIKASCPECGHKVPLTPAGFAHHNKPSGERCAASGLRPGEY